MVGTQIQNQRPRWEIWDALHYRNCSCKEPPLLCCVEIGTEEYYVHYIDGQTFIIAYIDTCDRRTLDFVVVKIEEKPKRPRVRVKYKIEANDVWFAKLSDIKELMQEAKQEGGKLLVFKEGEKLFRKFFWDVGEIKGYWKQVEIQI
ncbi:MAG: hypothetical protein ACO2PP_14580 [Thermocrinis sp.]